MPPAFDHLHGIAGARVGFAIDGAEVVECAENVVVVARREGEFQECCIRDLTGGTPPKKATLQQVLFAAAPGRRDLRGNPDGTLVLQQPFQDAEGGVERGARIPLLEPAEQQVLRERGIDFPVENLTTPHLTFATKP